MYRPFLLAGCCVLATLPLAGAQRSSTWRQIVTPGLIVAGDARSTELTRTHEEIARFRDSFAHLVPGSTTTSAVPTWVVVLRDHRTFERFQPRDERGRRASNIVGFFMRRPDANLIVLGAGRGQRSLQTLLHEYTHYILSRNARAFVPLWLGEGLADFYSTFRVDAQGQTLVGVPRTNHLRRLRTAAPVPLRDIVSPRAQDPMWRRPGRVATFYSTAWALVHYITVERSNPVSNPLATYLMTFSRTGDHDVAFADAFGTDVHGMEKELREYIRRASFSALTFDVQVPVPVAGEPQPMLEADVHALQARVLLEVGARGDAGAAVRAALERQPSHAAALTTAARLHLVEGREDAAIATLQRVVAVVPGDAAAQYYLADALERAWRHEEALAAYERAIAVMPGSADPWMGLNAAALALKRDTQASAAVERAMQLEWSSRHYWTQGLQALRLGRNDVASDSLAKYVELQVIGDDMSVNPLFVRALAARRAGRHADADAALAVAKKGETSDEWTRTVLGFLQAEINERGLLSRARTVGQRTEARTYLGFTLALAGRETEATTHFAWVAEHGAPGVVEYELAKNELNRAKYNNRGTTPAR